jgi:hypothetical protein
MNVITPPTGWVLAVYALCITCAHGQYHGILINGQEGTQIYDPFNTPHAQGNLMLDLQNGTTAFRTAAVLNGQLAYFGGNGMWATQSHSYCTNASPAVQRTGQNTALQITINFTYKSVSLLGWGLIGRKKLSRIESIEILDRSS